MSRALRACRSQLPGAAALALGAGQLQRLPEVLTRREAVARRYGAMRHRGVLRLPPGGERSWEGYVVGLPDRVSRDAMRDFLRAGGIACASPMWFRSDPLTPRPGLSRFLETSLALPLHAALGDAEVKRVINRVHRWLQRYSVEGIAKHPQANGDIF
ncbi:MAG: DegT/DnrJ/EryC1/StrS aminotransferase family protein [Magnetococcales bacterium]|nr:DegT/DnrJ/EryC1/StrS aminotransferase family protein [Magnetococcales bacterium]